MSDLLVPVAVERWADPASVFAARFAQEEHVFWLDAGPGATQGWSWIGTGLPDDPDRVRRVRAGASADGDVSGPFRSGWVGWIGYDAAAAAAGAPAAFDDGDVPHEVWLRADRIVGFDHSSRRAWVFAAAQAGPALAAAVAATGETWPAPEPAHDVGIADARHAPDEYARLIERCREAIREGDAYQLCLTTRFGVEAAVDPIEAYGRLRSATPSHHGGLIRSGAVALVSASPERFLQVSGTDAEGGAVVRTRPIKGTRPRGADPATDVALASELHTSEKERAENIMIVDLMRNDLSRVCVPGSVGVDGLLEIESYPAVHQLVSTVSGELVPGTTVGDLLDAAFPAGSMTGAPKLSAMTILHGLEGGPRGIFAGCFGWVGDDGALDLAMVIRSLVIGPDRAYVGAGGGITWRSDAAAEVAEVGVKARGPLAALGAALPPGW
ncbi:anthranilate synthase component I family protein [Microbacterium yannicii]|uniref:anthranilate synthase component I family protein n=1 Tax=Microbacterium yannicii TaxID=671622 RepID=UPI00030A8DDE|nr:anthranilate synthase component I family protein [Microbacterium yannicii]